MFDLYSSYVRASDPIIMPCGNLGKKNSRNIWENKKIVSKSYSTPTNYIGSDIVHQVNKQKKTKDALVDFASTTTKWYTPINLNRPIILNSKQKPIQYHERKLGKQIMKVNNRNINLGGFGFM